jgi:hypothetical protein
LRESKELLEAPTAISARRQPSTPNASGGYPTSSGAIRPTSARLTTGIGVVAPLALLTWVALHSVITFDGGMNMEVASSISSGNGFAWDYGGHSVSPIYIQTSGAFLAVAAAGIKLFGTSPLGLQFANLAFLAGLLTAVSRALRPWHALQVFGPLAFILIIPRSLNASDGSIGSLGGFGEFAVGFFMVSSFLLISSVVEGADRPLRRITAANLLLGLSLTTKVITIAEAPAVVAAFVLVALCRPDITRARLAASGLAVLLPVAVFEVYRALEFGSVSDWANYWRTQLDRVRGEASGPPQMRQRLTASATGWDRVAALGTRIGVNSALLVTLLFLVPLAAIVISYVRHHASWRVWICQPRRPLATLLAIVVATYIPWYVFISPLDWPRHIAVAWIALSLLALLLCGFAIDEQTGRRQPAAGGGRRRGSGRLMAVYTLIALSAAIPTYCVAANLSDVVGSSDDSWQAERLASDYVADRAAAGDQFCGIGYSFASVVEVTAHLGMCDLETIDACTLAERKLFDEGRVFLVWSPQSAYHNPGGPPESGKFAYVKTGQMKSYATIWRVSLQNGACASTPR